MIGEVINGANHIVEVALSSLGLDELGKRQLPTVAYLPLGRQALRAKHHAQHRPPQERESFPAKLR